MPKLGACATSHITRKVKSKAESFVVLWCLTRQNVGLFDGIGPVQIISTKEETPQRKF